MSNHINYRTSTPVRPATTGGTTTKVGVPTPEQPQRKRVGPVAIVVGAAAIVGAGALVAVSVTESDTPSAVVIEDLGRSQRLVQESIDAALAGQAVQSDPGRSQRLVQESIDAALAGQAVQSDPGRSQRLVQESIDAALAEADQAAAIASDLAVENQMRTLQYLQRGHVSYDVAEANRMSTLHTLQSAQPSSEASHDAAEVNRANTLRDLQTIQPRAQLATPQPDAPAVRSLRRGY